MIVRTGLAPYPRDLANNNESEKNSRGSRAFAPVENTVAQDKASRSRATPPVEQTLEGEILDRRRQRQYSESVAHFRTEPQTEPQSSDFRETPYSSRALAAYQSNIQLAVSQYQSANRQIDYFV